MADQQHGAFAPDRLRRCAAAMAIQCSRLPEAGRRFPVVDLYPDGYST